MLLAEHGRFACVTGLCSIWSQTDGRKLTARTGGSEKKEYLVRSMLWPRIGYWSGFALTGFGLFYAMTGLSNSTELLARSTTQTGGGLFALLGVLAMVGGKAWMDAIVRRRNRVHCLSCAHAVPLTAQHCDNCGAPQRTTPQMLHTLCEKRNDIDGRPSVFCSKCGSQSSERAAFCANCGMALSTRTGVAP